MNSLSFEKGRLGGKYVSIFGRRAAESSLGIVLSKLMGYWTIQEFGWMFLKVLSVTSLQTVLQIIAFEKILFLN